MDNEKNIFEPVLLSGTNDTTGQDDYGYPAEGNGSNGSSDDSF